MSFVMDSGSGWPWSLFSIGFGSNRSIWLGPPSMKMKIHAFAFGVVWFGFGESGFTPGTAPYPSRPSSAVSASPPIPPAAVVRN